MKVVKQGWDWIRQPNGYDLLQQIEEAERTCYKSEDKITPTSCEEFVRRMIKSGHHAMIEHAQIPPVRVITDRGVTHEIVRHRLFSFAQESTRYCNYSNEKFGREITVIEPCFYSIGASLFKSSIAPATEFESTQEKNYSIWWTAMREVEEHYLRMLGNGATPQEARSVLPNSLKTEIIITGNAREWRHFFTLRCSKAAHPQMRSLALDMLEGFNKTVPVLFEDIYNTYFEKE